MTAVGVLFTSAAGAEDGGFVSIPLPDASVPDASIDVGTPEVDDNPEANDGQIPKTCLQSRDCDRGFVCHAGRCVYTAPRFAGCSCNTAPRLGIACLLFAYWVLLPRRRTSQSP